MLRMSNRIVYEHISINKSLKYPLVSGHARVELGQGRPYKEANHIFISGDSYLAFVASPYYHILVDIIGQYELLKSLRPDIKLVIVATSETYMSELLSIAIEAYEPQIVNASSADFVKSITAESTYAIVNQQHFARQLFWKTESGMFQNIQHFLDLEKPDGITGARVDMFLAAIKKLNSIFPKKSDKERPKKIYSIRNSSKSSDNLEVTEQLYHSRMHPQEEKIAKYFESKGYTIVNFGDYSMEQQIDICRDATHFAGTKGSNLINASFMPAGGTVIGIHTANWWNYPFEEYLGHYEHHYIPVNTKLLLDANGKEVLAPQNNARFDDINNILLELDELENL